MSDRLMAKVRVSSLQDSRGYRWRVPEGGGQSVKGSTPEKVMELVQMDAVYGDSPENKAWSEATPSANFKMSITNPSAWGFFEPDADYLVTFERVK